MTLNLDLETILAPLEVEFLGPQGPEFVTLVRQVVAAEANQPGGVDIANYVMYLRAIRLYQDNRWLLPVWIGISVVGLVTLGHYLGKRL